MMRACGVGDTDDLDDQGEQLLLALVADLDSGFAELVRTYERVVYSVALRLSSRFVRSVESVRGDSSAFAEAYRERQGVHFVGSDTTGVVCFPTCPHARRITLAHRHGFRTAGAAIASGYRPCRHCRPTAEVIPA